METSVGGTTPFVSLCVITGDEGLLPALPGHPDTGMPILERLLKSIAGRDMVDEVILSWNGTKRELLDEIVAKFKSAFTIKVAPRPWDGDFAAARNHAFEAASGEWRGYLDTDDVIPSPGHPAIAASYEAAGVKPPTGDGAPTTPPPSFKEWLRALPAKWNVVLLPYHYINDEKGLPIQRTPWHGRFWRWHTGWAWTSMVHEDADPILGNVAKAAFNAGLPILHYPAVSSADRVKRNVEIMLRMKELAGNEFEKDFRLLYGLGSALADQRNPDASVYLRAAVEVAPTPPDRFQTLLVLHQAEIEFRRYDRAILAALMAIETEPTDAMGYFALAEGCYWRGEWARCVHWYEMGATKAPRVLGLHLDHPEKRTLWPKTFTATAYLKLGNPQRAIELCSEVLEVRPHERAVQVTLYEAQKAATLGKVRDGLKAIAEHGALIGEFCWVQDVFYGLPDDLRDDREIAKLKAALGSVRRSPSLNDLAQDDGIVARVTAGFTGRLLTQCRDARALGDALCEGSPGESTMVVAPFCAPGDVPQDITITPQRVLHTFALKKRLTELRVEKDGAGLAWTVARFDPEKTVHAHPYVSIFAPVFTETWGPTTPRTRGIGASEESVVYLAEGLAALGWEVTVYAPLDQPDIYVKNGVRWRKVSEFDLWAPCDLLIVHRAPWVVQQAPAAKRVILWHQDAGYPPDIWGPKVVEKCEHVVPSAWLAKKLGIEKYVVLPNSVPEAHAGERVISAAPIRSPHRAVWASNPTRGLAYLLDLWPEIRAAVPDATLDIFYGWELVTALGLESMKHLLAYRSEIEARVAALKDEGVTWRGRVGQDQLAKEFATAGAMTYTPVNFEEGACVSLLRAQAAGCIPVFVGTGALPEVQPFQKYMVTAPWAEGGRAQFVKAVVDAMTADVNRAELAAKVPLWGETAKKWAGLLGG